MYINAEYYNPENFGAAFTR